LFHGEYQLGLGIHSPRGNIESDIWPNYHSGFLELYYLELPNSQSVYRHIGGQWFGLEWFIDADLI
jgi:hypothetical protein